jgi:hypothetical protein
MLFPNFHNTIEHTRDTVADISEDFHDITKDVKEFVINNPHATIAILSAAASIIRAIRGYTVSNRINRITYQKDYRWYDPHTGFTWDLKRKLTNNDRLEITRRIRNGEDVYDILRNIRAI